MARVIIAAVFFVLVMTLGATAVSYQGDALGKKYTIEGETISASGAGFAAGEVVNTTNSNIDAAVYATDSRVAVEKSGVEYVEGTDYEWNQVNGSVTILAGGDLVGKSDALIDYRFHIPTQRQRDIVTFIGGQLTVASALVYVFGAIIGVAFLRLLAGAA